MVQDRGNGSARSDNSRMEYEIARRAARYAYERYLVARARLEAAAVAAGVDVERGDVRHQPAVGSLRGRRKS